MYTWHFTKQYLCTLIAVFLSLSRVRDVMVSLWTLYNVIGALNCVRKCILTPNSMRICSIFHFFFFYFWCVHQTWCTPLYERCSSRNIQGIVSGRASSVHGVKSSGSVIIVVVVSNRKSRTFSVSIYYYSAQSIYCPTISLASLSSTQQQQLWTRRVQLDLRKKQWN